MHLVRNWRGRGAFAAILAMAMLGVSLIVGSAPVTEAQSGPAATIKQVTLSGAEENPPVTANATGFFSGTLRENSIEFDLSAVAPEITQAHFHMGAKGANGPVVAFLFGPADPAVGAIHPTGTITQANLVGPLAGNWKGFADALAKGDIYVNVHTTANPSGAIRAQVPATTLVAPKPPGTGNSAVASGSDWSPAGLAGGILVASAAGMLLLMAVRRRA